MSLLETILVQKRSEVCTLRALYKDSLYTSAIARPPMSIEAWRRMPKAPLRIIAEIKQKSPSAGELPSRFSVVERGALYAQAGAAAISVLTDTTFFGGSFGDLQQISAAIAVPTLCKEFVLDESQLVHAGRHGAAWVLLIARLFSSRRERLGELVAFSRAQGLEPLVEVVSADELEWALSAKATLIGVNARDLDTLAIDTAQAARVIQQIPQECISIHLSGLRTQDDIAAIWHTRADAVLVGEALMKAPDPQMLLASMVRAAQHGHPL